MNSESVFPYRLMAPGPVPVHPRALEVMARQPVHHRTPQFSATLKNCSTQLQKVFQTSQPVMTLSSTGTGAMEAAIANCLNPGDRVLVIEAGKFGERWTQMAEQFGCEVETIAVPWGMTVAPDQIRRELQYSSFKAVLIQACETSTGALMPIEEIGKIVRGQDETLLIVDGITAVGATPIYMDRWSIDVLIAGSQKAFMLPTGLSFIALSEAAWQATSHNQQKKFYLDLKKEKKANELNQTAYSSSVSLIGALEVVLEVMLEDGLSFHLKQIENLALATRLGAKVLGLEMLPDPPSPSLSVFKMPAGVDGQELRSHLERKYNITIMGGQDRLKGKIIRIGHMGAISHEDTVETIRHIGYSLHDLQPLKFGESLADDAAQAAEALLQDLAAKNRFSNSPSGTSSKAPI